MKTIIFSLLMTMTFGFAARTEGKPNKLNQELKLRVNQQKTVRSGELTIKFVSVVEDSRCPAGVNCIWAGNGKIKIKVTGKNKKSANFELNTNLSPKSVTFQGREIKLSSLEPFPKKDSAVKNKDYFATFIL